MLIRIATETSIHLLLLGLLRWHEDTWDELALTSLSAEGVASLRLDVYRLRLGGEGLLAFRQCHAFLEVTQVDQALTHGPSILLGLILFLLRRGLLGGRSAVFEIEVIEE